jgi:hypothetical protein
MTDILGYCHLKGCYDFNIDFAMRSTESEIIIRAKMDKVSEAVLENLNHVLNIPRQYEVEQYCWNIGGEEEIDDELSLAGMMIDKATVTYDHGILQICALRYEASSEE